MMRDKRFRDMLNRNNAAEMMNNKLRSNAGESISETLVALLISALAIVMLAGAIAASSRIVTSSRNKLNTYYNGNEVLVRLNMGSETDIAVNSGSNHHIKITAGTENIESRNIDYFENHAFEKNKVIAYKLSAPTTTTTP